MNNYTIKSFVALIRTFSVKLVNKSAYEQCVTKNDVQNVHRQPAHKLTNDDATDESQIWTNRCCDVTMMSSLDTALPSKQEKYLPTCMLGPLHCDGACQKLRNQMQNYLKYMNKTSGTFFREM